MNEESKSGREQQIENKLKEAMSRKKAPVVFRLCAGCGRPFPESRMGHVGNEVYKCKECLFCER